MCGIVGYIGSRAVPALLLDGLKRLEYRGYDSCGIAVLDNEIPKVFRSIGRIALLEEKVNGSIGLKATSGIGHTRWATHGKPSEVNAHPHRDCSGQFLVAHNGIIENYLELRRTLSAKGHTFLSGTDTEVLPHLIESYFQGSLEEAVKAALRDVEGVYSIVAISTRDNSKIVAARKGAPLVLGLGHGENFVASDAPALLPYTREMLFLNDSEIAVVRRDSIELQDFAGKPVSRQPERITWSASAAEKEGYPHFMLKEIFEQPRAVRDTLCGRLDGNKSVTLEDGFGSPEIFASVDRMHIVACGTSLHAALVGKFMIESLARIPVEVDCASEFRYRDPLLGSNSLALAISQSGETADTLAALNEARAKGAYLLSICNVVGSMAARQSNSVLYTHAGPEIGVASTKAFTTQLVALYLLALYLGQVRGRLAQDEEERCIRAVRQIPDQMERILENAERIAFHAERLTSYQNALFLGRGLSYPIALEGALKLKEVSYIHAEGYPAGEMKHGPIALIDKEMPVMVLAPQDSVYRKIMGSIEEVKSRDGIVFAIATEGDTEILQKADETFFIPPSDTMLSPLLSVIPLQLLAYSVAVLRGCDVDKPRNLAKSVTVE